MSECVASIIGSILVATVAIYAQAAIRAPCTFTTCRISTLIASSNWPRWASTRATLRRDTPCAPFKYHASCLAYALSATTATRCFAYASTDPITSTCLPMMANSALEIRTRTFWTWVWAQTFDIYILFFFKQNHVDILKLLWKKKTVDLYILKVFDLFK